MFIWWVFSGFAWLSSLVIQVDGDHTPSRTIPLWISLRCQLYCRDYHLSFTQKFKIDEDFGFNKMTAKMYVLDTVKSSLMLFIIIGGAIFALLGVDY